MPAVRRTSAHRRRLQTLSPSLPSSGAPRSADSNHQSTPWLNQFCAARLYSDRVRRPSCPRPSVCRAGDEPPPRYRSSGQAPPAGGEGRVRRCDEQPGQERKPSCTAEGACTAKDSIVTSRSSSHSTHWSCSLGSLCRQNILPAAEVGELETGFAGPSSRTWCSVAN